MNRIRKKMVLPEQLLLLYLDDNLGISNERQVNYFLIAATLAELCLCHRLEYQTDGAILIKDKTPMGHSVLDAALHFISSLDINVARRRVGYIELQEDDLYIWIELLQKDLVIDNKGSSTHINQFWKFVAHALSHKGILKENEKRGWLFNTTDYKSNDFTEKRRLINAVREAVSSECEVDERMAHLISLVYKSDEIFMSGNLISRYSRVIPQDEFEMWSEKYNGLCNEMLIVRKVGEAAAHVMEVADRRGSLMPPQIHG